MRLRLPTRGLRWYFEHNDGHLIDKWVHYFDVYERHFEPFRGQGPTMLEIGVSHGGSLQMWRHYLGRRSHIVGIDIEPRVAQLAEPGIDVEVGSQSDPGFLSRLVERYGPFDIVLDDGSHWYDDQRVSLEVLWPAVRDGGVYMVEDVHTSYMADYEGAAGRRDTFIGETRERIDDLHRFWSSPGGPQPNEWTHTLGGVHVYDSIVVFDKVHRGRPDRRMTGRPAFDTLYDHPVDEMIDDAHRAQLASLNRPAARVRRTLRDPRGAVARLRTKLSG